MKTLPQINSNCIAGKSCVNFEDLEKFETEMLSMFHNLLDKKISLEQFYKDLKEGKHFKQEDLAMHEKAMLIAYNGVKISIQTFILWTALGILFEHIVKDGKSLTDQVGRAFIIQSFVAVAFEMADGNHKGLTRFIPSYLENEKMSYLLLNAGEVQKLANFIEKEGSKFAKEFAKQLGDSAHYINLTGAYNEDDYRVIKGLKTLRRFAFNFLNQLEKMPKYNASREYHQIKHDKKFEHLAKFEVFSKKCANYGGSFLINTAIPNFIEDGTDGIFERLLPDDVFGASYGAVLAIC